MNNMPISAPYAVTSKVSKAKKKELYNVLGELLFSTKADEINVRHFARGVYYVTCEGESKKVVIE